MNKLSIFVKVILVLSVIPSIFGLSDCFIEDQSGNRHKVNPETDVISNDVPLEEDQIISFGCRVDFYGDGTCMLKRVFGNKKRFWKARVGDASDLYKDGRMIFERISEKSNGYGLDYCIVSIQSVNKPVKPPGNRLIREWHYGDNGTWIFSEFIPRREYYIMNNKKQNWVRDKL